MILLAAVLGAGGVFCLIAAYLHWAFKGDGE